MIRPPDLLVITDYGKHPAYLKGEYSGGLLLACTDSGVFLINPVSLKLVTFAGTELDLSFEKCDTDIWEILNG